MRSSIRFSLALLVGVAFFATGVAGAAPAEVALAVEGKARLPIIGLLLRWRRKLRQLLDDFQ